MNTITSFSAQQLRRAAEIKDKIQSLENELNKMFGSPAKPAVAPAPKKRRKMSEKARKKIAAAAKARWAKIKGAKKNESSAAAKN